MDENYDVFKVNATIITTLHQRIQELREANSRSEEYYRRLYPAKGYMDQLVVLIKENPTVLDAWQHFLSVADIAEPPWKDEYVVDWLPVD